MRLDLRSILHVPGASLPFSFALDLSGLDFYGEHPFVGPVQVSGTVRNQADALVLEGTAETTLELAVSYTHLDVYKRQPVMCCGQKMEEFVPNTTDRCV